MKLNTALVHQTLSQFDAQAIPENHPAVPQLSEVFGEHTFFLSSSGLHIVEPLESADAEPEAGTVIKVAAWTSENRDSLAPHEPQTTGVVIPFKAGDSEPAA